MPPLTFSEILRTSPSSYERAHAAGQMGRDTFSGYIDYLKPVLADTSPFVNGEGDQARIGEVRLVVLEALQKTYRIHKIAPDFGVVEVRKAMRASESVERAGQVPDGDRRRVAEEVERILRLRVNPRPADEAAARAYLLLQRLGLVEYRREETDPRTYMTPLQDEVRQNQTASARIRPHLRVADKDAPSRTFGFIYRVDGSWVHDFAEGAGPDEAEDITRWIMNGRKLPRPVLDSEGRTKLRADGRVESNGEVTPASDTCDFLLAVRAQLGHRFNMELVL